LCCSVVYKIRYPPQWAESNRRRFEGSPLTYARLHPLLLARPAGGTALRYFSDQPTWWFLAIAALSVLGDFYVWETSVNGGPFPHIYSPPRPPCYPNTASRPAASFDEFVPLR